jgi:hypothetical protein
MAIVDELCVTFNIDASFIKGIVAITKRDYNPIVEFANRFGQVDPEKVQQFVDLLGQLNLMGGSGSGSSRPGAKLLGGAGGWDAELFQMFDKDKNGNLDFGEFLDMLKYLNLPLSHTKALNVFSEVQKGDWTIGEQEFEKALGLLEDQVAGKVLGMMGLSSKEMIGAFQVLTIILCLLFAFT